ncbi:chymotrypsin-1-like [Maniola hyperantus]|uniref:chymotrypsin-1-like n=1 Tax=Aphantopus hyperantus TaxID=2795564 RepID=UPI00156A72F7|nr:collagenase-like [Maniola hyperantus]
MKVLVLLVSLAAFVSAGTVPDYSKFNPVYGYLTRFGIPEAERIQKAEEAYLNSQSSRIVGGFPAARAQIPYQAGLISDIIGQTGRGVCGGSLITNNRILTAAHCWFDGRNHAWRFTVVLGSHLLFTGGTRILTSAVKMHDEWFPWLIRNDIAMAHLPNRVVFTDTISSISIPTGSLLDQDFSGSQATVSGFGLIDNAETISPDQFLSYARVSVITNSACNLAFPTIIQDSHICTSTLGGSGPDRGDSGGPLITEWGGRLIQIGVVSFGSALDLRLPAAYARVTKFNDFIQKNK